MFLYYVRRCYLNFDILYIYIMFMLFFIPYRILIIFLMLYLALLGLISLQQTSNHGLWFNHLKRIVPHFH